MDEYYVKNGRHGNKEVEYSPAYIDQKKSTAAWSDAWTRYNKHVTDSCRNLGRAPRTYSIPHSTGSLGNHNKGSSCKTLKIEDLIISPNTEMTEIYKWFGIQVDPEANGTRNKISSVLIIF